MCIVLQSLGDPVFTRAFRQLGGWVPGSDRELHGGRGWDARTRCHPDEGLHPHDQQILWHGMCQSGGPDFIENRNATLGSLVLYFMHNVWFF